MEFIIKAAAGDYYGEGDTWNEDRSYAVRFDSREQAEAKAESIRALVYVEPWVL